MRTASLKTSRMPLWFRGLNHLGRAAALVGVEASLEPDSLMKAAVKTTGGQEFTDLSFQEPLEVLCQSMNKEARLHPLGRFFSKVRLTNVLATRLRAEAYARSNSDLLAAPARSPIVITGLQRTGTTFLQRLLGSVPGLRTLKSWEALNPVPFEGESAAEKRIAEAKRSEQALRVMAPDFFAIHPVEHQSPEEEVLLLDNALLSTVPEATMHVPAYSHWLEHQDNEPAYRHLARLLAMLEHPSAEQGQNSPIWVLKTPHHLEFLEELATVFPDFIWIHTHRDPRETLPSFFSMIWHGRKVFSDVVPPYEVAMHWGNKVGRMLDRADRFRREHPSVRVHDVAYRDLVADPLTTVAGILDFCGLAKSSQEREDTLALVKSAMQNHTAHKYGRHVYDLQDFDLKASDLDPWIEEYCQTFKAYIE